MLVLLFQFSRKSCLLFIMNIFSVSGDTEVKEFQAPRVTCLYILDAIIIDFLAFGLAVNAIPVGSMLLVLLCNLHGTTP